MKNKNERFRIVREYCCLNQEKVGKPERSREEAEEIAGVQSKKKNRNSMLEKTIRSAAPWGDARPGIRYECCHYYNPRGTVCPAIQRRWAIKHQAHRPFRRPQARRGLRSGTCFHPARPVYVEIKASFCLNYLCFSVCSYHHQQQLWHCCDTLSPRQ